MIEEIKTKIEAELKPEIISIEDDSGQHVGHAGYTEGVSSHLAISIVSNAFSGKSRITRQRMAFACFQEKFNEGLHAVTKLETLTPEEYKDK